MLQDYQVLQSIGKGTYGDVRLCVRRADKKVLVMKVINTASMGVVEKEGLNKEVMLLGELNHPYIVKFFGSFSDAKHLYITMENCAGGDLSKKILELIEKKEILSEKQAYVWFYQLASALKHCHDHKILHRDLKPSNVLLTDDQTVKLGDFGISKSLDGTSSLASTVVGTPYSMSPELCHSVPYGYASDIWGLGCIFYELLALKRPFEGASLLDLVWHICKSETPEISGNYNFLLKNLIYKMLSKEPETRPTIEDIIQELRPHVSTTLLSPCFSPKSVLSRDGERGERADSDHIFELSHLNTESQENKSIMSVGSPPSIRFFNAESDLTVKKVDSVSNMSRSSGKHQRRAGGTSTTLGPANKMVNLQQPISARMNLPPASQIVGSSSENISPTPYVVALNPAPSTSRAGLKTPQAGMTPVQFNLRRATDISKHSGDNSARLFSFNSPQLGFNPTASPPPTSFDDEKSGSHVRRLSSELLHFPQPSPLHNPPISASLAPQINVSSLVNNLATPRGRSVNGRSPPVSPQTQISHPSSLRLQSVKTKSLNGNLQNHLYVCNFIIL